MNEKITLSNLIQLLALKTGDSKKQSEDFIKELFQIISSSLENGEQVKIKNLGVFKTVTVGARKSVNVSTGEELEIPSHRKVVFTPSKEVASLINAPFEMFDSVEIKDEISEGDDSTIDSVTGYETEESYANIPEIETDNSDNLTKRSDLEKASEVLQTDEAKNHQTESNEIDINKIAVPTRKPRFGIGFLTGFLCAAAIVAIIIWLIYIDYIDFNFNNFKDNNDKKIERISSVKESKAANQLSIDELSDKTTSIISGKKKLTDNDDLNVPTEQSDKIVYDTITKTRYLTTMAKDHYGNYHLWPYIYMENQKFLGHPDRIKPGTRIVIPSLSKYGVNPKNQTDIEEAKKKGIEIYNRFQ